MSTLLLVRHAETDIAGTFCGSSDPPVNARGHDQISALLKSLPGTLVDVVYSSDLQRASTTAQAIAYAHGALLRLDAHLRELDFGAWESLRWPQVEQLHPAFSARWLAEFPALAAPDGEHFAAFEQRALSAFDEIVLRGEDAIIVTHAGVMRAVMTQRCGFSEPDAWARTRDYCCVVDASQACCMHGTSATHLTTEATKENQR